MRARMISTFKLVAKFAFAFGILWYMVAKGKLDLSVVRRGFSHLDDLAGAAALVLLALAFSLYRWKLLLRGQGVELSASQAVRYGMIGAFFNTTMPGAVSGDLIKAWYVISDFRGRHKTPILTSILLDRVLGVFGLVIVAASPILLFGHTVWAIAGLHKVIIPVLALFAGVVGFVAYVMLSGWGPLALLRKKASALEGNRVAATLLQAYDSWTGYRTRPGILAAALALSVANFLCMTGVALLCGQAISETQLSTLHYFLLVPLGLLATAIPVAPAGLGVGHAAFNWLFLLAGSPNGPELFTMMVSVQILFNLMGVIFYLSAPKVVPEPT
jgi:uncharacterized membrane protein YbhN (UPF0104 family)